MIINRKIKECRELKNLQERLLCLMKLYQETADGMTAYALAEEFEIQSRLDNVQIRNVTGTLVGKLL